MSVKEYIAKKKEEFGKFVTHQREVGEQRQKLYRANEEARMSSESKRISSENAFLQKRVTLARKKKRMEKLRSRLDGGSSGSGSLGFSGIGEGMMSSFGTGKGSGSGSILEGFGGGSGKSSSSLFPTSSIIPGGSVMGGLFGESVRHRRKKKKR
jgi:hypothetical protein